MAGNPSVFTINGNLLACFEFKESLRAGVRESLDWLLRQGLEVSILSGDAADKVEALTKALDLPLKHAGAGLSPDGKAAWLASEAPDQALMVGDGANDALAFEKAACRATPVVGRGILEQHSDFFFLGNGIRGIVDVFRLAKRRKHAIHEVFAFTLLYNLSVVVLSLAGGMNPLLAAVLMPLSSIFTLSWTGFRLSSKDLNRRFHRIP
jgi:Cu2+-exporting ATPase